MKFKFIIHDTNKIGAPATQAFEIMCDFKTAANLHFVIGSTLPPTYYITFKKM